MSDIIYIKCLYLLYTTGHYTVLDICSRQHHSTRYASVAAPPDVPPSAHTEIALCLMSEPTLAVQHMLLLS